MQPLNLKHYRALAILVAGGTNEQAAKEAGVSLSSIDKWKARPDFSKLLQESTLKIYEAALAKLALGADTAVDQLLEIVSDFDVSAKIKVSAINILLSHVAKSKEAVLEHRLEKLETLLDDSPNQIQDTET